MADEEDILLHDKKLNEYRVVDLKKECDKRGLSKGGSKSQIIERLKAQLLLEKLQQQPINDSDEAPNSKLKEEVTGNNAFIKQYLEKQQRLLVVEREARKRFSEEESESSQDERPGDSPKKRASREPSIPEESPKAEAAKKEENKPPPPPPTPPPPKPLDGSGDTELTRRFRRKSSTFEEEPSEPREPVEEPKSSRKSRRWRREPETKEAEPEQERGVQTRQHSSQEAKDHTDGISTGSVQEKVMETTGETTLGMEQNVPLEPTQAKSESGVNNSFTSEVSSEMEEVQINKGPPEPTEKMEVETPVKTDIVEQDSSDTVKKEDDSRSVETEEVKPEESADITDDKSGSHNRQLVDESQDKSGKEDQGEGISKGRSRSSSSSSRSRSRSADNRSKSSSRSRSRTPKKTIASRISRKDSTSSSSSSSSSRSSSSGSSRKGSRSPSPKPRRQSKSPLPQEKSESPVHARSSSSESDKSRSRSRSPEQMVQSPPKSSASPVRQSPSPVHMSQESVKDKTEEEEETPTKRKAENQADHADTLIVTEDTSEKALDQKREDQEQKDNTETQPKKISVSGRESKDHEDDKEDEGEKENKKEKPVRKRKWGSSTRSSTETKPAKRLSSINISTDSLKELIPDIKMTEPVLDLGNDDEKISDTEEDQRDVVKSLRRTVVMKDEEEEKTDKKPDAVTEEMKDGDGKEESEDSEEEMEVDETPKKEVIPKKEPTIIRRVSQPVPLQETDEPIAPPRSPSPARNPISKIIHVRNLVRPFTQNQLLDLLGRTGTIVEKEFWIDKIKSHCFVMYETEEQAVQTRKALHNTKWPSSNPKILRLEYSSKDEIQYHKQKEEGPKAIRREVQQDPKEKKEKEKEKKEREREPQRKKEETKQPPPIREWDRDKIRQSRERELGPEQKGRMRSRSPSPSRGRRGRERSRERDRRDRRAAPEKKVEDEPPAKLLDDLFKKTKTTPCIYWLPLTDAQAALRDKERMERMAARERIRAETGGENRPPQRDRPDRSDFDRRRPPSPKRSSPPRRSNEQDSYRDRSGQRRPDRGGARPRSRSKSPRRRR